MIEHSIVHHWITVHRKTFISEGACCVFITRAHTAVHRLIRAKSVTVKLNFQS